MNAAPPSAAAASLPLAELLHHAASAVQAVRAGRSLNEALARVPAAARPGSQALAFHALRWLGSAVGARERLAPQPPAPALDALLLVAVALLLPDGEAPYATHTLVDQAVEAARRRQPRSAPFVNAVLRRFLRERRALLGSLQADPVARWNHPRWWCDRLARDWPTDAEALLAADNQRPPMALRVNARRGDAAGYVARLAEAGMAAQARGAQGVVLETPCPVDRLPGFAAGDVSVQDLAAQRAAPLLIGDGLPTGARVLDACAAPGGKTAHLLELAELDVLALDSDASRLARVTESLARLGLAARVQVGDAGDAPTWWDGRPFDAILLDAPCSASGIVRRHPDVRWLRRESDIAALAATQERLLESLWPLLAPGGRLVYCTCSVFKAEGQQRVDAFLQRHAEARAAPSPYAPGHLLPLPHNGASAPLHPFDAPADGFFYALVHKS